MFFKGFALLLLVALGMAYLRSREAKKPAVAQERAVAPPEQHTRGRSAFAVHQVDAMPWTAFEDRASIPHLTPSSQSARRNPGVSTLALPPCTTEFPASGTAVGDHAWYQSAGTFTNVTATGGDHDAVVQFWEFGLLRLQVAVQGHAHVNLQIPIGSYVVRVIAGDNWCSFARGFTKQWIDSQNKIALYPFRPIALRIGR